VSDTHVSDSAREAPAQAGGFNLSDWALRNRSLVFFLMLAAAIAGAVSYMRLGREEDPAFTIKIMVVRALWPGATTEDTIRQVTDRLEKKLEETPSLDFVRSYTKPGETTIFVSLKDSTPAREVADIWYQVRKKVGDIQATLPAGVIGPFFNDEFGDTYSIIYALTADGFTPRETRDAAERMRAEFLRVQDVTKVDLIGAQDEKIYLEFSIDKLGGLGLTLDQLVQTLRAQNVVTPAGVIETSGEKIIIRVSGEFVDEASIAAINLRLNGRFFRLADIVDVRRSSVDPPQPLFRYRGEPAIGVAVTMRKGGDVLALGEGVAATRARILADLPIGFDLERVANQSVVVEHAIGEFMKTLMEAIAIVLGVSLLALGLRAGLVVAVAIPLVLAVTFVAMEIFGVTLQRISLGALIIALGLLVDDAMISVEMMMKKLEEGWEKSRAAAFAYTSTAFPMLTGTLVTIFGFLPVGFAKSAAGEYTFSLFAVVSISLIVSWVVAVLFTPLTGVYLLPDRMAAHHAEPGLVGRAFRRLLEGALRLRWLVLLATATIFALALVGMTRVQQQFFPSSDRPELIVNLTLPQNATIGATRAEVDKLEASLKDDEDILYWSSYVGMGAVRFYLPLDQQLANDYFAQLVVVTKGEAARDRARARIARLLETQFDTLHTRVSALESGPPVGWPLRFRISGPDGQRARTLALDFAAELAQRSDVASPHLDWNEPTKVIRLDVDQDQARLIGVSSQSIAQQLNAVISGASVTTLRDDVYLVEVVARAVASERADLDTLRNITIEAPGGRRAPLSQVARLTYDFEQPLVWRRGRLPLVTVQADVAAGREAATVIKEMGPAIEAFRARLPRGYDLAIGGATEDSAKAQASLAAVVPMMLLAMMTVLMIQLRSFQRMAMALLTGPLALIGVAAALLLFRVPMGFVAILGVISLLGMVIRNSVILIDQIETERAAGREPWEAVIVATEHRLRPILLTAAAAILGMLPIAPTVFWGPMAYAVIGGLSVATLLTLVFLPALYVVWFRIRPPAPPPAPEEAAPEPAPAPG
jgi:multidrug efflux pump subunit AcrB